VTRDQVTKLSPAAAAGLSFVLPGLGQFALGARRRGIAFALPAVIGLVAAAAVAVQSWNTIVDLLLRRDVLLALIGLNLLALAYHAVSIADAYWLGRRRARGGERPTAASVVLLFAFLGTTIGVHGWLGIVGYDAYETVGSVFVPQPSGGGWIPSASFASSSPSPVASQPSATATATSSPTIAPTPTREATPRPTSAVTPGWARDGRLNLLLIGSDAGPDRWSLRTDTMIVLSLDVAKERAALFGIPRNLIGVPLAPEDAAAFPDGRFPGLLNALYVYAMGHPEVFPGGEARGFRAVSGAVQELIGVPLDGMVVVNLAGFVQLVDALGGLWINVPARLVDAGYPLEDGTGYIAIDIQPGCQQLDGRMALAYARSRHQDSDYGRMGRQQLVLVALRQQLDLMALLPRIPRLLTIARDNLWMTIDPADMAGILRVADRVGVKRMTTVLFVPPRYPEYIDSGEIEQIRTVVRDVFTHPAPDVVRPTLGPCP
jgi:LCP family protein required for cell wall assembly